jgi:hypothetical protein
MSWVAAHESGLKAAIFCSCSFEKNVCNCAYTFMTIGIIYHRYFYSDMIRTSKSLQVRQRHIVWTQLKYQFVRGLISTKSRRKVKSNDSNGSKYILFQCLKSQLFRGKPSRWSRESPTYSLASFVPLFPLFLGNFIDGESLSTNNTSHSWETGAWKHRYLTHSLCPNPGRRGEEYSAIRINLQGLKFSKFSPKVWGTERGVF